jgi:hypothetical protein
MVDDKSTPFPMQQFQGRPTAVDEDIDRAIRWTMAGITPDNARKTVETLTQIDATCA